MSRISSYKKLKLKITALEKEKGELVSDIRVLVKGIPDSMDYMSVRHKWNFKFDVEQLIWHGTTSRFYDKQLLGKGIFGQITDNT